jgi:hypothetical protein
MNRKHDYPALEREYIAGDMSIRELARRHGIFNASLVHVQARKGDWVTKRAEYRRRAQHKTMERLADGDARRAARELEVRDHAIEVIDQALTRLSEDMTATHVVERDGRQTVEPLVRVTPKDVALLLDRFTVLFNRPAATSSHHLDINIDAGTEIAIDLDALRQLGEIARERSRGARPQPVFDGLASGPDIQRPMSLITSGRSASSNESELD